MNLWSRLGVTVAIAAAFCIVLMEGFQHKPGYQRFRWYGCAGLSLAGGVLTIVRIVSRHRQKELMVQARDNEDDTVASTADLPSRFGFWGPILIAFGCIVLCVPYKEKPSVVARVAPEPRAALPKPTLPAPEPAQAPTNAPPTFPEIKINGLIYRPPRNAIVVSGRSYFQGDLIAAARVFSISADAVVLELNGHYKVVDIDPLLQPRTKVSGRSASGN